MHFTCIFLLVLVFHLFLRSNSQPATSFSASLHPLNSIHCDPGCYYDDDITDPKCKLCPPGYYCVGGSTMEPCPGGRYGDYSLVGKSIMVEACPNECIKGKYGNLKGQVDEDQACPSYCKVTEYGTRQGAIAETIACAPCLPGRYCPGRTTLSLDLILLKSAVTSIFTLPLATSLKEFITELILPEL